MKELFDKAGIESKSYTRPPLGTEVFALALNEKRDMVRFHLPNENVLIENERFSTKHNQVSFSVVEPRRVIEKTVQLSKYTYGYGSNYKPEWSEWDLQRYFGINLPETTKYEAVKSEKIKDRYSNSDYTLYDVTIKATVPKSTQHFLVGYDEHHLFVSGLPKAAKSIEDAHKILRPKGVTGSTLRQGEWFFLPADVDEAEFDQKYVNRVRRAQYDQRIGDFTNIANNVWNGSFSTNHKAAMVVSVKGKKYVKGLVFDTTGRHDSILLPKWHLVVKNKEVVNRTDSLNWD